MKKILFCLLVLTQNVFANTYYFSDAIGNDSYSSAQAQNPATPWKTIAKCNSFFSSLSPGDFVRFNGGEYFPGTIICSRSGSAGNPITITSYGTGKPIISGWVTLSSGGAINDGGNIYRYPATGAKSSLCLVAIDGLMKGVGRWPNQGASNGGYAEYQSYSTNTAITSTQLNAAVLNWTGAEAVIKKGAHLLETNNVTSASGSTINYTIQSGINEHGTPATSSTPKDVPRGFFIQRDIRTLDEFGEWYLNPSTKDLSVYLAGGVPASYTVKVSVIDTLIDVNSRTYITIDGLRLDGANYAAVSTSNGGNFICINTEIYQSGRKGVLVWNCPNTIINYNDIQQTGNSAIDITNRNVLTTTVYGNTIHYAGSLFISNLSGNNDNDGKAISVSVDSIAIIRKNRVVSAGYVGIQFQGNNFKVDSNFVDSGLIHKDDGGLIYTYNQRQGYNRIVHNNILLHAVGSNFGNGVQGKVFGNRDQHAEHWYGDGGAGGMEIYNNYMAYGTGRGLYLNDPKFVNAYGNISFKTAGWTINKHGNDSTSHTIISRNQFYNDSTEQYLRHTTINDDLSSSNPPTAATIQIYIQKLPGTGGYIDSNYYAPITTNFKWIHQATSGGAYVNSLNYNFGGWQAYSGWDANSQTLGLPNYSTMAFHYNDTDAPMIISFPGYAKNVVTGLTLTSYNNSYTLAPWTAVVLLDNGFAPPASRTYFLRGRHN